MASVFRQQYKKRNGQRGESRVWYAAFADPNGQWRRIPGFTDKKATEELGRKLERLAGLKAAGEQPEPALLKWVEMLPQKTRDRIAAFGLVGSRSIAAGKAISEHVADFKKSLRDKGNTAKHAELSGNRIQAVLDGIGVKHLRDIQAGTVLSYLADRRKLARKDKGLSTVSSNHHLQAIKSFCTWLVRERRISENPLAYVSKLNERADRRHERRALETDELIGLIDAAKAGPGRYGISGPDRAMLYRLAVETGLRASELGSLTAESFELGGDESYVTVRAAYSKHRRDDTLPLRPDTADELSAYLADRQPGERVFAMPPIQHVAQMLRADLDAARTAWLATSKTDDERAKREKTSYLKDRDEAGRVVDFHALRHTFISNLARGGVHPKDAQTLARHSTITLTMDRYTHVRRDNLSKALASLPTLPKLTGDAEKTAATDDATAA